MNFYSWEKKYKPIENPAYKDNIEFSTCGNDVEFLKHQNPLTIWTRLICDGVDWIQNGVHYVNRNNYYVTEVPFEENDDIEVIVSRESDYDENGTRTIDEEEEE